MSIYRKSEASNTERLWLATALNRLIEWSVLNPTSVILAWLLLALASLPLVVELQSRLSATSSIPGSESEQAELLADHYFSYTTNQRGIIVLSEIKPTDSDEDLKFLEEITKKIKSLNDVISASSIIDFNHAMMLGSNGFGAIIFVEISENAESSKLNSDLKKIRNELIVSKFYNSKSEMRWTGDFFLNSDLISGSEESARTGELIAIPATLLILFLIFSGIRSALCPIVVSVFSIIIALGISGLIAMTTGWEPSILLQNVISLIGLGLTIDYSLLTVTRLHEARERDSSPQSTTIKAAKLTSPTIFFAGLSVTVGFSSLLVVPIGEIRSIATGGLLASLLSVATSITLLPAILGLVASKILQGCAPAGGSAMEAFWRRTAQKMAARPAVFLSLSSILLILVSWPVTSLKIAAPDESWLPSQSESIQGQHALERIGRRGLANEMPLILQLAGDESFSNPVGWASAKIFKQRIERLEGIETVIGLPGFLPGDSGSGLLELAPRTVLEPFLSENKQFMLFRAFPANDAQFADLTYAVSTIREILTQEPLPATSAKVFVGGIPASTSDYLEVIELWAPAVIGLVIFGAFVILTIAYRAPIMALKGVLLNLFSIAAAFGLATIVFIYGVGADFLGANQVDGVLPAIPLVVFCAVFGVSMDYEVILISRAAELRRNGLSPREATVGALAKTGMTITGAATIMIVVFGSFVATSFLPVQILGFTLAAAVLIDAFLIRVFVSPALMTALGHWNWWPEPKN